MLGQATAVLEHGPRRWIQRLWGSPDIHTRQKWMEVWPHLARLPQEGVRLLDAGCSTGRWTLELAARRPGWSLVGVDREEASVSVAERDRQRLGLCNAAFITSDFLQFEPARPFDVVLSVMSAHYLAEQGAGGELFRRFRCWLRPGGRLILLAPRGIAEAPFISWLPHPAWRDVFIAEELRALCAESGLAVEELAGRIGRLGTLAKQLDWAVHKRHRVLFLPLYPLLCMLSSADRLLCRPGQRPTLTWRLVARTPRDEPVEKPGPYSNGCARNSV